MIPAALVVSRRTRDHAAVWLRDLGVALVFTGALALGAQFVVDLMVAVLAQGDADAGGALFDQVQASGVINATLYTVGPAVMFVGLIVQAVAVARVASVARWAPVALAVGPTVVGIARVVDSGAMELAGLALIAVALAASVDPPRPRAA